MAGQTVSMAPHGRGRSVIALAWASVAMIGVLVCPTPALAAAAERAGDAVVVTGAGERRVRNEGGSATEFSVRLPDGASCPGDSANDGYRVQSYLVPTTVAPAEITYDGLGPTPNTYRDYPTFRQPLYDTSTRPFASAQTAEAAAPGQAGAIVSIPSLTFAVYGPGELPPGRYRAGIACTLDNQPVRYWDTELVLTLAPDDKPAGITWRLANATAAVTGSNGPAGVTAIAAVVVVVAVAAGALYARRRRRPHSLTNSTEEP